MNPIVKAFLRPRLGQWVSVQITKDLMLTGKLADVDDDGLTIVAVDGRAFAITAQMILLACDAANPAELESQAEARQKAAAASGH